MLSYFKWYRKWRGGRWAKITGLMFNVKWIKVSDACVERCDEDYR